MRIGPSRARAGLASGTPRAAAGHAAARAGAAAAVMAAAVAAAAVAAAAGAGGVEGAWAQAADTPPTLGVLIADTPPHHYKDDDGRTVIVGQVVNTNAFAVSGVKVRVGFYGAAGGEPLETAVGTTLIGVVPAGGTAPFAITSESPSAAISGAAATILGFNYADEKPGTLSVEGAAAAAAAAAAADAGAPAGAAEGAAGRQPVPDTLVVEGEVRSSAAPGAPAEDAVTVHVLQYDAFDPPRLLRHASAVLPGPLEAGGSAPFSISDALLVRADGVRLIAESAGAASAAVDVAIAQADPLVRRVTIGGAHLSDADGNRVQGGREGSPLVVGADLTLDVLPSAQPAAQDYTLYVQVKRSGDSPSVEFLGSSDGLFDGPGPQSPSVEWTPGEEGLYFVETFVWDSGNAPLASRGPVVLVLVSRG